MQYQLHIASPEVLKLCTGDFDVNKADMTPLPDVDTYVQRRRYPFHRMQIGHCFIVPFEEGNEPAMKDYLVSQQSQKIRSAVSKANAKAQARFIVKKHAEHKIFEVARIA